MNIFIAFIGPGSMVAAGLAGMSVAFCFVCAYQSMVTGLSFGEIARIYINRLLGRGP